MPTHTVRSEPVAIVTAASRGIGAACARTLVRAGLNVALMSRTSGAITLADELGGLGLQGSVTEPEDLARLVDETLKRFGRIDGVVNNTGDPRRGDLLELTDEDWHADLDLILLNVFRMSRLVTPIMTAQGRGSIVNISAADAHEPEQRFPIGSTYRAALGAWTKLYADRYAASGIRMNGVLPGIILPEHSPGPFEDFDQRVPMGRAGLYTEVADLVAFLLSDVSSYLTGQNIRIDGGLTRGL